VVPDQFQAFYIASAGVAGALVGLLFVAVSVTMERMAERGETQIHRVRASAALSAFTNALVLSLFAIAPGGGLAVAAIVASGLGLSHIVGSLMSLMRLRTPRPSELTDALFLVSLAVIFVFELLSGIRLAGNASAHGPNTTLPLLVIFCFTVGIYRAWDLIGGPTIGVVGELRAFARGRQAGTGADSGAADQRRAQEPAARDPQVGSNGEPDPDAGPSGD
jgi:uncharacterized membrane protein